MLKTLITAALLLISFNRFALALSDDSTALRNCRMMPNPADRNLCADTVKGHRFDNHAVEACADGRDYLDNYGPATTRCLQAIRGQEFDRSSVRQCTGLLGDDLVTCLTLIANRKPQDANAFRGACFRTVDRKAILPCMRQITWQPLRPADSTTHETGAAGR